MKEILSLCPAGFQAVVEAVIRRSMPVSEVRLDDGAVTWRTDADWKQIRNLRCVNNSFHILGRVPESITRSVSEAAWTFARDAAAKDALRASVSTGSRTYRIMFSEENQTVSVPGGVLQELKKTIERETHLAFRPGHADVEFWIIGRRARGVLLCRRLTHREKTEAHLAHGELRPEIANLLCELSEPGPDDIVLDPFAGHGAIPLERCRSPYEMVFASDLNPRCVHHIRHLIRTAGNREKRYYRKLIAREADARALDRFEQGFISKIITDPPWGAFDETVDVELLYRGMLDEFARVLKPGGVLVALSARKETLDGLLVDHVSDFGDVRRLDVLVSGKKAGVFRCTRK